MSDMPLFRGGAIRVGAKFSRPSMLSDHEADGVPIYDSTGCITELASAHVGP